MKSSASATIDAELHGVEVKVWEAGFPDDHRFAER
jgi:hypothetical protein